MIEKPFVVSVLAIVVFGGSVAETSAQASCIEPFKPVVEQFSESEAKNDLRREYELYFNDVEAYLECLNAESHRVHDEAKRAAYEYDSMLDRSSPIQEELADKPRQPMVTSGHLNLDFRGAGG